MIQYQHVYWIFTTFHVDLWLIVHIPTGYLFKFKSKSDNFYERTRHFLFSLTFDLSSVYMNAVCLYPSMHFLLFLSLWKALKIKFVWDCGLQINFVKTLQPEEELPVFFRSQRQYMMLLLELRGWFDDTCYHWMMAIKVI